MEYTTRIYNNNVINVVRWVAERGDSGVYLCLFMFSHKLPVKWFVHNL